MEDLNWLRKEINKIDEELVKLFEKRMEIVYKVAEYKIKNSMKVLDREREVQVISKSIEYVKDQSLKDEVKEFFESVMAISRKIQEQRIEAASNCSVAEKKEPNQENDLHISAVDENKKAEKVKVSGKVGFQGVLGSFSHEALTEYFDEETQVMGYQNFKDVFEALEKDEIEFGVLPIENSSTGGISEVCDLLGKYGFFIVGEKCIKVDHNLLAVHGAELSDIEEVYSHNQGFLQSKNFLDEYPNWKLIPYFNTAKSAQYVSEEKAKNKACISNKKCAELYGLKFLKENINYNSNNYTRFIVIGRNMQVQEDSNKISIVVALPHDVGALHNVLRHFADNDLNMLKIESRPMAEKSWQYFFYIDFSGNILKENAKKALKGIQYESLYFKLLGNYNKDM
ncbi:chorismate mutase [Clostridium sp. DJ247]|uniref:chorismate mutase n=1 Tax=Clostridium sp. DJ247 TaxID=2726188 RepID=UPI001625B52F|nr:chorismate mutase [Clostridium sp. DJ247]MBC2582012.1 chorismate mutase [Clostridium sp. DJ247]